MDGVGGAVELLPEKFPQHTHTHRHRSPYSTVQYGENPGAQTGAGPDVGRQLGRVAVVVVVVVVDTVTPGCFLQSETDPSRHRTKHLFYRVQEVSAL